MECCLLCLELQKETVDSIAVSSGQWNELNVKSILYKYLWPMNHIETTSWMCRDCWGELYDFHTFYTRIEEAHNDFGLLADKVIEVKKTLFSSEDIINEVSENGTNDLQENERDKLKECSVNEINVYGQLDSSQNDFEIEQQKPLVKDELSEQLLPDTVLLPKRKRGRPRKESEKNKQRKAKSSCNGLISKENKCRESELFDIPAKCIDVIENNNMNDQNNLEIKSECHLLPDLTETEFPIDSYNNLSDKTSGELIDTHSDIKPITDIKIPPKIEHNEKDKFLAENFKITCFLCNIPFETFFNMLKHFEVHHAEPGHVKCCNKKFYRRSILVDHVHYHLNPNYFKCIQCGKVMADRRCLELHIESHEINHEKNHCCDICGKAFAKSGTLKKHRMIHLSDEEKRFSCSECGKNHYRSVHLKNYIKICDICGKSIRCKDVFERHMLHHQGKVAPSVCCDVCGLILTDKKALKRHKGIIHPIGGQHEYTCSICSKTSPNLRAHKRHVQYKHVMGYDHKCTICEKAFKRAPTLKEHMASHTGTILYTCPWCPKTFNSNANMHNHRKKVHPKEWEEASRRRYSGNLPPNYKAPALTDHVQFTVPLDV